MAITPNDFSKIWASNADTPEYTFSEADYLKGWDFVGNLPPTRAQWNAMQKSTDEKMKYVFDNFGAPLTASTVAEMTMRNRVYVYTGSETGYTAGHWYYWNGSAWTDGGVYNSNTVQVDPTLSISGAAADAKVVGDKFNEITSGTNNIFDPQYLESVNSWSKDGDAYKGRIHDLYRAYNTTSYPATFESNTQYTFSFKGKTDGNDTTSGYGIRALFRYSDSTADYATFLPNTTNTYTEQALTSRAGKTVVGLCFDYGSAANNIWYLKDIQLEKGTTPTAYVPYLSAVDYVARKGCSELEEKVDVVLPYFDKQIGSADFSDATLEATYVGRKMYVNIPANVVTTIEIVSSDSSDTNNLYLNLYSNGVRLTAPGILNGYGTRTITLNNTYGVEITEIDAVLVKVNELNSYDFTFYVGKYIPWIVETLEAEVDALMDGSVLIPSYYETHLANAIASAQTNIANAGINGENFVFISDIHWENNEKNSPTLIKEITKKLPIENTIFGGDAFNGGTQSAKITDMNDIRAKFTSASPHFLSVFGNHDDDQLDGGTQFTHKEFYTFLQKQSDYYVQYEAPCYYYMDNEATKTRFIVMDTGTGTPPTATAQLTWLNSIIDSAPAGYHFIVFAHVVFYPQSGGSYSDPTTWIMSPFMTNVCNALDSAKNNGKNVEALFGGHCHYDWNTTTTGGIPIVLIDCDTKQTQTGNPQSAGTVNEQAFDIVTVDYSSSTIYCTRVGRGSNRTITY